MNVALFADLHGRIRLCFKLCARWERETGERIDLVLQAGDLGVYPHPERLDRATIKHARRDPTELGFAQDFVERREEIAAELAGTSFPLVFVRGNHEDQLWLDQLETQSPDTIFPIDAYQRIFCLKTGMPYTFVQADEQITILGIGRIGALPGAQEETDPKYIQPYELERLYSPGQLSCDLLLTHDISLNDRQQGMEEIRLVLDAVRPPYHFHGHTEEPYTRRQDQNGVTEVIKLSDLHWDLQVGMAVEAGAMGILRWHNVDEHEFAVVEAAWLAEYRAKTWQKIK